MYQWKKKKKSWKIKGGGGEGGALNTLLCYLKLDCK